MSRSERRAILLLVGLAVTGHALRWLVTRPGDAPGEVHLLGIGPASSPRAHRDSAASVGRPLAPGERVDVDRASVQELIRLPRVGPGLAKTIVADRQAHGPFGGLNGLDRVPGVGPGLLKAVEQHVRFTGVSVAGRDQGGAAPLDLNTADSSALERLPGIGPALAGRIVRYREQRGPFTSTDSLVRVPGVGPATLARLRDRVATP